MFHAFAANDLRGLTIRLFSYQDGESFASEVITVRIGAKQA